MLNFDYCGLFHYLDPFHPLNGNTFYIFDYYFYLKSIGVDAKLIFIIDQAHYYPPEHNKEYFLNIMKDRYDLSNVDFEDDFIFDTLDVVMRLKYKFKYAICTDKTYDKCNRMIPVQKLFVWGTWWSLSDINSISVQNIISDKKCVFLNESKAVGGVNYHRRMLLDRMWNKPADNNIFLYIGGERYIDEQQFRDIVLPKKGNHNNILVYGSPQHKYAPEKNYSYFEQYDFVEFHTMHPSRFFERFQTYFYVLPKGIDYAPRLLIEAAWLNKEILYYRNGEIDDGGMSRYHDIQNNNIGQYNLSKDDWLIQELLCGD